MLADWLKKIKGLKTYESEIWLILLVALILALLLGVWQILVARPKVEPIRIVNVPTGQGVGDSPVVKTQNQVAFGNYVASKNGTRYYLPTCAGVSRIKEENKIYFATVAEAEARGLTPAVNCPGL